MTRAMWTEITQQCFLLSSFKEGKHSRRADIISRIFDARAGKTRGGPTNIKRVCCVLGTGSGPCPVSESVVTLFPPPYSPFTIRNSYSQKKSAEYAYAPRSPSSQKNFKKNSSHSWTFFSHGVGRSSLFFSFLIPSSVSINFPVRRSNGSRLRSRLRGIYDSRASFLPLFLSFLCHRFASSSSVPQE